MNASTIADYAHTLGLQARSAATLMAKAPTATRNAALRKLAALLRANLGSLQVDNSRDIRKIFINLRVQ